MPSNPKSAILAYVKEVNNATTKDKEVKKVMGEVEVSWHLPSKNWVKLNMNGTTKHKANKASCVG